MIQRDLDDTRYIGTVLRRPKRLYILWTHNNFVIHCNRFANLFNTTFDYAVLRGEWFEHGLKTSLIDEHKTKGSNLTLPLPTLQKIQELL